MTQWGLDTLFNPAKRHMDEEKRRLQSTRSEVGDNSGGRRIDLESGKVVISKADDEAAESDDAETPEDGAKTAKAKNDGKDAPASSKPLRPADIDEADLTPAQRRARERRRKAGS
jgi:hypothetical protein